MRILDMKYQAVKINFEPRERETECNFAYEWETRQKRGGGERTILEQSSRRRCESYERRRYISSAIKKNPWTVCDVSQRITWNERLWFCYTIALLPIRVWWLFEWNNDLYNDLHGWNKYSSHGSSSRGIT